MKYILFPRFLADRTPLGISKKESSRFRMAKAMRFRGGRNIPFAPRAEIFQSSLQDFVIPGR